MFGFLLRRLVYTLPIMVGVALVCFALVHISPGDPLGQLFRALAAHNKLDNLILDPDRLEPVAILDWDQGTRGDPLDEFERQILQ